MGNTITLSKFTALQVVVWWVGICLIVPLVLFGSFGHGSIFLIHPVWFLALTGSILQCIVFINYKGQNFIVRGLLVAIVSAIIAAVLMAMAWGEPVLSIFNKEHIYIFYLLLPFSVTLSFAMSKFIKNRAVGNEKNA